MKSRQFNRISTGEGIQITLMLAPLAVLFLAFNLYPLLSSLFYSFTKYNGISILSFVGFKNYIRLFSDASWWGAVLNTFQFTLMAYAVQVPLSLILAVLVNSKIKGKNFFRTMFFLPNVTSTAVIGIIFFFMFSSYNGIVNGVLQSMSLIDRPIEWLANIWLAKAVIILLNTWSQLGFFMVLFLAAIQKIPAELYESAKIDGANKPSQFKNITLPMLGSMFPVITMMVILNAFQLFDSVKVLTGGGPGNKTTVMALYIYNYFFTSTGAQQGYASALSVCATVLTAAVGFLYYYLTNKKFHDA
jgi:raffinose/stachyose/melibiose transport system permease protein